MIETALLSVLEPQALQRWGRGMSAMPVVASHAFARDFTCRLREVARFHDATVHAALSVALARAMGAVRAWDRPIRVMSPISLRGILGVKDECGIFIGGGSAALDPAGDSFRDEARKTRAALEPFMNSDAAHNMIAGMTAFGDNDDSPAGARAGFCRRLRFRRAADQGTAWPRPHQGRSRPDRAGVGPGRACRGGRDPGG